MRLTDRVYEQLQDAIVSLQLPPGAPISELDLCRRFAASRTPVRAALNRLAREGLIVAAPMGARSRLVVAPLTADDMRQLFLIVGALDGLAARLAAARGSATCEAVATRLEQVNGDLKELIAQPERLTVRRVEALDADFHRTYHVAAAAPQLLAHLDALQARRRRYVRVYTQALVHERSLRESVAEHDEIIRAFRAGDSEAAERCAVSNYHRGIGRFAKALQLVGEVGQWFSDVGSWGSLERRAER